MNKFYKILRILFYKLKDIEYTSIAILSLHLNFRKYLVNNVNKNSVNKSALSDSLFISTYDQLTMKGLITT